MRRIRRSPGDRREGWLAGRGKGKKKLRERVMSVEGEKKGYEKGDQGGGKGSDGATNS